MENTNNLKLPLLVPNQSGKEITHNEALVMLDNLINNGVIDKDLSTPPENPNINDLYIVGVGASGLWVGKDRHLAYFDNGWRFNQPKKGTIYWVNDEACFYVFTGTIWTKYSSGEGSGTGSGGVSTFSDLEDVYLASLTSGDLVKFNGSSFVNSKELQGLLKIGVGCDADNNNKLAVKSDNILFDNNGTGSRVKVNKKTTNDVASHLFQNNYSGRAEFGLVGNDDFSLKVSADGNEWTESFVVDRTTGDVDFKGEVTKNGSPIGGSGGCSNVWISDELSLVSGVISCEHNLNLTNPIYTSATAMLKCVVADSSTGYSVGEYAASWGPIAGTSSQIIGISPTPLVGINSIELPTMNIGTALFYIIKKIGGGYTSIPANSSNWKLIFKILY